MTTRSPTPGQDLEIRPGVPRPVRLDAARPQLPQRVRAVLQPRPPPHRYRATHPHRHRGRPRRGHRPTTTVDPRRRPGSHPTPVHQEPRPENPRPPRRRLDQPTHHPDWRSRTGDRLHRRTTPAGLNHLDKFRSRRIHTLDRSQISSERNHIGAAAACNGDYEPMRAMLTVVTPGPSGSTGKPPPSMTSTSCSTAMPGHAQAWCLALTTSERR